jgi:hypothetical protein
MSQAELAVLDDDYVLTLEEIGNLAAEGGNAAETLMNVAALIAKPNPTAPTSCSQRRSDYDSSVSARCACPFTKA